MELDAVREDHVYDIDHTFHWKLTMILEAMILEAMYSVSVDFDLLEWDQWN